MNPKDASLFRRQTRTVRNHRPSGRGRHGRSLSSARLPPWARCSPEDSPLKAFAEETARIQRFDRESPVNRLCRVQLKSVLWMTPVHDPEVGAMASRIGSGGRSVSPRVRARAHKIGAVKPSFLPLGRRPRAGLFSGKPTYPAHPAQSPGSAAGATSSVGAPTRPRGLFPDAP